MIPCKQMSDLSSSGWILGPASSAVWSVRSSCARKSTVTEIICNSSLAVDLHHVFYCIRRLKLMIKALCARICICISASVEYYRLMFSFLTSFSQHVRALIHSLHKVMMLQWPGDCELSQAISCDGALVSAQTCSFGVILLATMLSFKEARNMQMGLLSLQAESCKTPPHSLCTLWSNIY